MGEVSGVAGPCPQNMHFVWLREENLCLGEELPRSAIQAVCPARLQWQPFPL